MQYITINAHPTVKKLFTGRKIVIASMHGKHLVIKPLIHQYLKLHTVVIPNIDTDEFGTFSGEIERVDDPVLTLRKKIIKGLKQSGETLGIGSEGSFGPHPSLPIVQADQELVMLIDLENDLEITATVTTTETNHAQEQIYFMKDLLDFAQRSQFPSHGLILKQIKGGKVIKIEKGIISWEHLHETFVEMRTPDTELVAETDMRAHLNPTRMKIIEKAAEKLMKKITQLCPDCQWPGFSCVEVKPGLVCRQCGQPTKLPLIKVYRCKSCNYTDERYYTSTDSADPQYCDICNP